MRYLKIYKLFESVGKDLQDILLEINDENYWKAECWSDPQSQNSIYPDAKWVVVIQTVDVDEEYETEGQTPTSSVIETIERAIDFMNGEGFVNYQITFEGDEDDQYEEITLDEVSELDVWSNNFIRIEFWK